MRPRKPTAVLELSGAIQRNPARYLNRQNEPQPTEDIGLPPSYLSTQEKKIWKEITNDVSWLKVTDRLSLEMVCRLVAKLRDGSIKSMELSTLITLVRVLGMSPSDRSRVNVTPIQPNNQWTSLLNSNPNIEFR
jgi:phage terminase small subunit